MNDEQRSEQEVEKGGGIFEDAACASPTEKDAQGNINENIASI